MTLTLAWSVKRPSRGQPTKDRCFVRSWSPDYRSSCEWIYCAVSNVLWGGFGNEVLPTGSRKVVELGQTAGRE
jgi:hypothetical protein